jgi:hypothetical protein
MCKKTSTDKSADWDGIANWRMINQPRYGSFDGLPARYNDHKAWILGREGWKRINMLNDMSTRPYSKSTFEQIFGTQLPPPLKGRSRLRSMSAR